MKRKPIITIVVVLLLAFIGYRLFWQSNHKRQEPPVTVTVAPVLQQKNVVISTEAIGAVTAYSTVNITALVNGALLKVDFKPGAMVTAGQVLFEIDSRPYEVALQQAEATLARDTASLHNAELAFKRAQALIKPHYISQQDFDTAKTNSATAAATVKADAANVANAQLELSYCTIRAPISGRAGDVLIHAGNLIKANDTNALTVINQIQPIYIAFSLPEQQLAYIQQHKTPSVSVSTLTTPSQQGNISFIDNAINTQTGTIGLKADFPNTQLTLWPGQYIKLKVPLYTLTNALLVPTQAVQAGPDGDYVYTLTGKDHVKLQPVKTGSIIGANTIITTGVTAHQRVITQGQMRLNDGALVQVAH